MPRLVWRKKLTGRCRMHLLIIDDDKGMSDFIEKAAAQRGWIVEATSTEDEFRTRFSAHHPDAVLLDLQLGPSDGIQQLKFLADQQYSGAIALMSGFDSRVLNTAKQLG